MYFNEKGILPRSSQTRARSNFKLENYPVLFFDESSVIQTTSQKHLGMNQDSQIDFKDYLQNTLK